MRNYMNLTGRVAVITGASSGLGNAFCKAMAENGAKIAAFARRAERLDLLRPGDPAGYRHDHVLADACHDHHKQLVPGSSCSGRNPRQCC